MGDEAGNGCSIGYLVSTTMGNPETGDPQKFRYIVSIEED